MAFEEKTKGYAFSDIRHISPNTKDFQGFVLGLRDARSGNEILEGSLPPIAKAAPDASEIDPEIQALNDRVAQLRHDNSELKDEINTVTGECDALDKELEEVNKSNAELAEDVCSAKEELRGVRKDVQVTKGKKDYLDAEVDQFLKNIDATKNAIKELQARKRAERAGEGGWWPPEWFM